MEQSESIAGLAAALANAQGEFPPIKRGKTAKIPTRSGGEYTYHYADLGDMLEQLQPILTKHGLAVLGGPNGYSIEGWTEEPVLMIKVDTQLVHTSGEWIRAAGVIACRGLDAQSMGSAITYARRYGYAAILGVAPDTDDDGQAALSKSSHTTSPDEALEKKRKVYFAKARDAGYTPDQAKALIKENYDLQSFNDANADQLTAACGFLDKKIAAKGHE